MAKVARKKANKKEVKKDPVPETTFENECVEAPEIPLAETQPGISISELQTMVRVINTATERGAFRGNELSTIGALYTKLTMFLKFIEETSSKKTN